MMSELVVGFSRGDYERQNECYNYSHLFVRIGDCESDISIIANQPVYPNDTNDGFDLVSKELSEELCYFPFKVEDIVFHDINNKGPFRDKLWEILAGLRNE